MPDKKPDVTTQAIEAHALAIAVEAGELQEAALQMAARLAPTFRPDLLLTLAQLLSMLRAARADIDRLAALADEAEAAPHFET